MTSRIVQPAASFQPPETCTEHEECQTAQAPHSELCDKALAHYEEISAAAHHWNSLVPRAIEFYKLYGSCASVAAVEGDAPLNTEPVPTTGLNIEAKSEIQRLMREKNWSRSDLARALEVSRVTITQMLDPARNLTLDTLEKVVRKMGYTVHLACQPQFENRYREDDDAAASPSLPAEPSQPLCAVHRRLEADGSLECEIGNDCVACSLNERRELLQLIAPFAATGNTEDSVTVMRRVAEFYATHAGDGRVIVSYPATAAELEGERETTTK